MRRSLLGVMLLASSLYLSASALAGEIEEFVISIPAVPFVGMPLPADGHLTTSVDGDNSQPSRAQEEELYSFQFDQTPLFVALRMIAEQTGRNIVAHSGLTGYLTLSLKDVTLDQALDIIARTQRLSYVLDGNVYIFGPADVFPGNQQTVQRVYRLQHTSKDVIDTMMERIASPDVTYVVDPMTRSVVIRGPQAEVDELLGVIKQLDTAQRQVMLMTSVMEITQDTAKRIGLNGKPDPEMEGDGIQFSLIDGILDIFTSNLSILGTTFEIQERLDTMHTNQNAKLLAMPSLATLNGREATIFLGDQVPIVIPGSGENAQSQIEWRDIGITLTYTPWISDADSVTFDLSVEIEAIDSWVNGIYPSTVSRNVTTTIRAENGQPIVIGGLFKQNEVEEIRKLALLGDLPILGPLFQHRTTRNEESEIVIVLIPYIY